MSYVYFDPHPKKKAGKGDCTVRAVSAALSVPWDTAYIDLVMQGFFLKDMPSSNEVMSSYLRSKRFSKHSIPDLCPDCYSFEDFANDHPEGVFIVGTGTHVACIKNSQIMDSWDSSECVVLYYYEREKL